MIRNLQRSGSGWPQVEKCPVKQFVLYLCVPVPIDCFSDMCGYYIFNDSKYMDLTVCIRCSLVESMF